MALRFTLRQLEYLVAVGEAGSIALAAARLHVSPPSVSTAIAGLEAELGLRLFLRRHARGFTPTPGLAFEPLATIEPHIMLPPGHPLAGRPALSPRDLAPHPMVLLDLPGSTAYFLSGFEAAGVVPAVAVRTRDMTLARSMVANGFGFCLVNVRPLSDLAADGKRLLYRPLVGGPGPLRLGLARVEGPRRTRAVAAFEAHCRALIGPSGIPGLRTA